MIPNKGDKVKTPFGIGTVTAIYDDEVQVRIEQPVPNLSYVESDKVYAFDESEINPN